MKTETRERIKCDVSGFVERILRTYVSRPASGRITIDIDLSQGGLAGLEAKFTERLK